MTPWSWKMIEVRDETQINELRISAVICTYRNAATLPEAIESLLFQSIPSDQYEIIVVDNNSQDETPTIVQRFSQNNPVRMKYEFESTQGLSHARNKGLQLASAEIVAFLDDDAIAEQGWLESLLDIYDHLSEAWAVGGKVLPIWSGERPKWFRDSMLRSLSIVDWGDVPRPLKWPERLIGTNCSFRKEVFSEVGLFATNLGRRGGLLLGHEDTEIQERIRKMGKLVFFTPRAVVHHHVPRERLSKAYFYRRAYGTGRSEAILVSRQAGCKALLKQVIQLGPRLLLKYYHLLATIKQENSRFQMYTELGYQFGFLYQAIQTILTDRDVSAQAIEND